MVAPLALLMKRGMPPTPRNARTGELTPPGIRSSARVKSCADLSFCSAGTGVIYLAFYEFSTLKIFESMERLQCSSPAKIRVHSLQPLPGRHKDIPDCGPAVIFPA